MYDKDIFRFAKRDLAWAMLSRRTHDAARNAELDFMRFLLEGAIIHGSIDEFDVECAIHYSGIYDYVAISERERVEALSWMLQHGERYSGVLSQEQKDELKLVHDLCDQLTHDGDLSALQKIADLVR